MIVDDHPATRYGLARLIDAEPDMMQAGQAGDTATALDLLPRCNPDVAVVDLMLGRDDGLELVKQLRSRQPSLPSLVFSMMDEGLFAERAIRAGARGYLMKDAATDVILAGIRAVLSGAIYVSKAVADAALRRIAGLAPSEADNPLSHLTDRELQIFILLGRGYDVHEIAERLYVSVHTIRAHREHIKVKLNFERSKDLLRYAAQFA